MDNRAEVRDFLATRRARLSPEQAGVVSAGGQRRVPGLRRDEVARLAGVSFYYTRLERGNLGGVPDIALCDLARASAPACPKLPVTSGREIALTPVQPTLDFMTDTVAMSPRHAWP